MLLWLPVQNNEQWIHLDSSVRLISLFPTSVPSQGMARRVPASVCRLRSQVYYTVAALQSFAAWVSDIDWMRASRYIRLNPVEAQVMWLGSPQQLRQVDIIDISVLSTKIKVAESPRNLGLPIDSQLSLHTSLPALQICTFPTSATTSSCSFTDNRSCQNVSSSFRFLPYRLLQLTVVWCV